MGDQGGRLDVMLRQTPRVAAGASAAELSWDQMWHRASVLAASGMVRKAYADKPEAIMYAGAKGAELGWSLVASLDFIDPIEGRAEVNAQGRLALIRQAGHEAETVNEMCDDTRATVRGRRRGSQEWHVVTWTIEEAEQAGLRAEWVEKWNDTQSGKRYCEKVTLRREGDRYVPAKFGQTELPPWAVKAIAEGKVKCNEGWFSYPGDKLVARAASRLCRRHFSEVLIGRGLSLHTADEQGYETASDLDETATEARVIVDQDDDVVDGEIEDEPAPTRPAACPHCWATDAVPLSSGLLCTNAWHDRRPAVDDERDEVYARRRARANAVMGEIGVTGNDRHAVVLAATLGATQSTGRLTHAQVEAVAAYCGGIKAAAAKMSEGEQRKAGSGRKSPVADHSEAPSPSLEDAPSGSSTAPAEAPDNDGPAVVGVPSAPGPAGSGAVPGEWRARAVEQGISDKRLLIEAQRIAAVLGLVQPSTLDEVTDLSVIGGLEEWIG